MQFIRSVPALPTRDTATAVAFYRDRLGFRVAYEDHGFAKVVRDDVQINLWQAGDETWRERTDFTETPVCSGAETFLAGTASCRVEVDDVDGLYAEMRERGVLHYADQGAAVDTDHGTREFAATDLDNNLIEFFTRIAAASSTST